MIFSLTGWFSKYSHNEEVLIMVIYSIAGFQKGGLQKKMNTVKD